MTANALVSLCFPLFIRPRISAVERWLYDYKLDIHALTTSSLGLVASTFFISAFIKPMANVIKIIQSSLVLLSDSKSLRPRINCDFWAIQRRTELLRVEQIVVSRSWMCEFCRVSHRFFREINELFSTMVRFSSSMVPFWSASSFSFSSIVDHWLTAVRRRARMVLEKLSFFYEDF